MYRIFADGKILYTPGDIARTVFSPKLTIELGKAGSLSFQLPPTHPLYGSLSRLKSRISVEEDGEEIYRGRPLSEERGFSNVKSVYCEGDLAYLVDSVQKSEKYVGTTHDLFRKIIAAHNARVEPEKRFQPGIIGIEDREVILAGQSDDIGDAETRDFDYKQIAVNSMTGEWQTTYDYIESCLIDYCGGYLRTRRVGDTVYLDLAEKYEENEGQRVEFGVNMLDLEEEMSAEDLFTVLIPLGNENLTVASVNGGSDELVDEAAVAKYGRIIKTHVFDSVDQANTLLENGRRYLQNQSNVPSAFTIRAVDMHLLKGDVKAIRAGSVVRIFSVPHGLDLKLTCTKIEYDLEDPANTSYTFGNPKQSLTDRYRKDKIETAVAAQQAAVSSAGGSGRAGGSAGIDAAEEVAEEQKQFEFWANERIDEEHGLILLNAGRIDENGKNIETVRLELDGAKKTIELHAGELNELYNIWEGARIHLDGIDQTIVLQAGQLDEQMELIKGAQITIDGLKSEIALKADLILLDGYVKMSEFEAEKGRFDQLISGTLHASSIAGDQIIFNRVRAVNNLGVYGYDVSWKDSTVVTDVWANTSTGYVVDSITFSSNSYNVKRVVTGVSIDYDTTTLNYLGR